MKQKNITLIGTVMIVSAIISLIIGNVFIAAPKNRQEQVEVVKEIAPGFKTPNPKYFNQRSINPTEQIIIGDDENQQPFNTGNQ